MKKEKWYVTSTDTFMSNWGRAKNRTNKLIFICDSYEDALIVSDNAKNRSDQKYVNICSSKPSYFQSTKGTDYELGNYFVQIKTKEDYPSWYKKDFFKKH